MEKKKVKVYIVKNYTEGYKVVLNGKHVDCSNPIFHSHNVTEKGLQMCEEFCVRKNLEVIRKCQ